MGRNNLPAISFSKSSTRTFERHGKSNTAWSIPCRLRRGRPANHDPLAIASGSPPAASSQNRDLFRDTRPNLPRKIAAKIGVECWLHQSGNQSERSAFQRAGMDSQPEKLASRIVDRMRKCKVCQANGSWIAGLEVGDPYLDTPDCIAHCSYFVVSLFDLGNDC